MPPVFGPRANLVSRASLLCAGTALVAGTAAWLGFAGSSYASGVDLSVWQPIPFSHAHHAGELGLDCRYCHASVETAAEAGLPSTDVCANCHLQLWTDADVLEPVRASWRQGTRLRWRRVVALPDFVFFEHSVHVTAGVSCGVCHGPVERMPLVYEAVPLTMEWCLDCHRDPWPRIEETPSLLARPTDAVPDGLPAPARRELRTDGLTNCSTCHR